MMLPRRVGGEELIWQGVQSIDQNYPELRCGKYRIVLEIYISWSRERLDKPLM
jgi:hypothetical protein